MSDRLAAIPTLEQRMDDVRAVMDAVGSERAAFFGVSEGGPMSILFAATYPQRTSALILYGTYARRMWSPDHSAGREAGAMNRRVFVTDFGALLARPPFVIRTRPSLPTSLTLTAWTAAASC